MNTRPNPDTSQLTQGEIGGPEIPWANLHLLSLHQVAVAQPLLDLAARHPELFAAHQSQPVDLWTLVLVTVLLLPMPLVLLSVLAGGTGQPWGRRAHLFGIGLLSTAFLATLAGKLPPETGWWPAAAAGALGLTATRLYARRRSVRLFATAISPMLLLTPVLFLFHPKILPIWHPEDGVEMRTIAGEEGPPVVLVVFDELPLFGLLEMGEQLEQSQIDSARFPNFAALASQAHWFRNATTVASETPVAIPALLTGLYPEPGPLAAPSLADHPQNLFTWLASSHAISAMESQTFLCPKEVNRADRQQTTDSGDEPEGGFRRRNQILLLDLGVVYAHLITPQPLRPGLPPLDLAWKGFLRGAQGSVNEAYRVERFERFVDSIEAPAKGHLYYLHSLLPHMPWEHLPSGKAYNDRLQVPGLAKDRKHWGSDERQIALAYQRFLLQLQAVDRLVGQLLDRLRELGIYEEAIVILTADHGASFTPGRARRGQPEEDLSREIMPIPLMIKMPFQNNGQARDENAELVDLLPTLANLLGTELPWPVDGRNLFDPNGDPRAQKLMHAGRPLQRLVYPAGPKPSGPDNEALRTYFSSGAGPMAKHDLFAFGSNAQWVGRSTAELPSPEPLSAQATEPPLVTLRGMDTWRDVDLSRPFLPAQVLGSIDGGQWGPGDSIGVALNGVLRTIVPIHIAAPIHSAVSSTKPLTFSAMLPEEAFQPGDNSLRLYRVHQAGPAARFFPLPTGTLTDRLEQQIARSTPVLEARGERLSVLAASPGTRTRVVSTAERTYLEISSSVIAPSIRLPAPSLPPGPGPLLLRLHLDSPARSRLLLHQVQEADTETLNLETPGTKKRRTLSHDLRQGPNTVYLSLSTGMQNQGLRVDLGRMPGTYRLYSLELWQQGPDAPIPLLQP